MHIYSSLCLISCIIICPFYKKDAITVKSSNCMTQLNTRKDTHNRFMILQSMLSEILPRIRSYRERIEPLWEFSKLHISKDSTFSALLSQQLIAIRILSYCKGDYPPNCISKIFLQHLTKNKCYKTEATKELSYLIKCIFTCRDANKNTYAYFNIHKFTAYFKIM